METLIDNLPLSAQEQESIQHHSSTVKDIVSHIENEKKKTSSKIKVYLVDDDRIVLRTLQHALTSMHHECLEIKAFSTAEDCLEYAEVFPPSIVILDYYLDHEHPAAMNGIRALRKLKQLCPEAKVVMLSAQNNIDIALNSFKNKAHDYVSKGDNAYYKIKNIVRQIANEIELNEQLKRQKSFLRFINIGFVIGFIAIMLLLQTLSKMFNPKWKTIDGDLSSDGDNAKELAIDGDETTDGDEALTWVIDGDIDSHKFMEISYTSLQIQG